MVSRAGLFLLEFITSPFVFIEDPKVALRMSNIIAVVLLFLTGYRFGNYIGYRRWRMGLYMLAIGLVLIGVAIALGG